MEIATPLPEQSAEKYRDNFFKDVLDVILSWGFFRNLLFTLGLSTNVREYYKQCFANLLFFTLLFGVVGIKSWCL